MATREIWRGMRRLHSSCNLWYSGAPEDSFLAFSGLFFVDQNYELLRQGNFQDHATKMWMTYAMKAPNPVAAGKAYALFQWMKSALERAGRTDPDVLALRLAEIDDIPFGSQTLSIDPTTHRPRKRDVYVLEVRNNMFNHMETLSVEGLPYYP
jgi:hypothetical protein